MALFHTTVVDNQIKALSTIGSASGSIATFDTDKAENLINLEVAITATGGGGTPVSPLPISGFSQADISVSGINLCDEVFETGDISFATGGNITGASWIRTTNYVPIVGGLTIYVKSERNINMFFYDCNKAYLGNNSEGLKPNIKNTEITISNNACYFRIATNQTPYNHDISINYPATDTQYHAYTGNLYTVAFGQTIYGGRLNVGSGVLTITHAIKTFDGSESFGTLSGQRCVFNISGIKVNPVSQIDDLICSHYKSDVQGALGDDFVYKTGENIAIVFRDSVHCVDVATFQAYLANQHSNGTPVQLVYWLATPIIIQLDSKQIQSIIGTNNVYCDTGDIIDLKFILSVGKAIS